MDQDAKQLLMERLDECLKVHADTLDAQDIGSIYELQELAKIHYYLKMDHEYTPAEVEALLFFQDPLDVARWCWEENIHVHSFPICDLLKQINAYKVFEQAEPEATFSDKYTKLMQLLSKNLYAYQEELLSCDKGSILARTEETAAIMAAYRFMQDMYSPKEKELDVLLRYGDPLKLIAGYWPDSAVTSGEAILCNVLEEIAFPPEKQTQTLKTIRERLQQAARNVKERPSSEKSHRDVGTR